MAQSYRISKEAEKDWHSIISYTLENFGERQAQKYTKSLLKCLEGLNNGAGQFKELDISGHRVLIKRCKKHYIFALWRIDQPLLIIAVFHEKMDLMQRLKYRFK